MKIDILARFKNKAFCVSFISSVLLLLQQLGLGDFLPDNIMDIVNTVLVILTMLGVVVDPLTPGIGDEKEDDFIGQ